MSEVDHPDIPPPNQAADPIPFRRSHPRWRSSPGQPRIKKLRLLLTLLGLSLIALVSTVFGMMMAVASDLPALENRQDLAHARNSTIIDLKGRRLGILTSKENRILVRARDIPAVVKHAMISVEDKRFYSNSGVDIAGIARAFLQDVGRRRAIQGASTITEQFVKNALRAQNHRTVFQKLREAALAYHLTRRWSKEKILTEYLNAIYFGNGAYGVESAARTYFGRDINHLGCGAPGHRLCVAELKPQEAALLAGMVASPAAYDPINHPQAARTRRNLVLKDMLDQRYLSRDAYTRALNEPLPSEKDLQPPQQTAVDPSTSYFIDWIKQQLVDRYGAQRAFEGGLRIRTTLDLDLQRSAEQAIAAHLGDPSGPTASLVAIDNQTGEVRAMIGGRSYRQSPFNLATQGQRQPGSAFKVFVLAQALRSGISPDSVWPSRKRVFLVPHGGGEKFTVRNFNNAYAGSSSLTRATTFSDNSVFAAVGIQVGVKHIAALAHRMGIRTPISRNYAITLGGLRQGVTTLDMAHAYETLANGGKRVTGTLGAPDAGPVGIHEVGVPGVGNQRDRPLVRRVLRSGLVQTENQMLATVIQQGTAINANIGEWAAGKTGTTENYGDAWFVGFNRHLTVAVWVGYPNRTKSMKTDYHGGPVEGGTFPAEVWHDFMLSAIGIYKQRDAQRARSGSGATGANAATTTPSTTSTSTGSPSSKPGAGTSPHGSRQPRGRTPGSPSRSAPATPPSTRHATPGPAPGAGHGPSRRVGGQGGGGAPPGRGGGGAPSGRNTGGASAGTP